MSSAIGDQLFKGGCILSLVAVVGSLYLFYTTHWAFALVAFGLVAIWFLICHRLNLREQKKLQALINNLCAVRNCAAPVLKLGTSYGYPTFDLTFATIQELNQAEKAGSIVAFKTEISELYSHHGSKQNPFDSERAVFATYVGWKPNLIYIDETRGAPPPRS